MTKKNRQTTQAGDVQMIAGIKKDLQSVPTLLLGADSYTPTTLTALFQSRIDAANAVAIAKAAWLKAVATYETLDTKGTVVAHDLKQYVMGAFGKTAQQLADFGFAPSPARPLRRQRRPPRRRRLRSRRLRP